MSKQLKSAVALTTVVATLATTQTALAEEVKPLETGDNAVTATALVVEVTKEDVANAEAAYNATKKVYDKTVSDVNGLEKDIDNVGHTTEELEEKVNNAKEATPEAIQTLEESIVVLEKDVNDAKEKASDADDAYTKAHEQKDNAATALETITEHLANEEENVRNAQNRVNEIKQVSPEDVEEAEREVEIASQDVEEKTNSVNTRKAELEDAKAFDASLEEAINIAKTKVDTLEVEKTEKEANAARLKAESDKAQAAYENANADRYNGFPTNIKLAQGFVDAFKEWMAFSDPSNEEAGALFERDRDAYFAKSDELRNKVLAEEKKVRDAATEHMVSRTYMLDYNTPEIKNVLEALVSAENSEDNETYNVSDLPKALLEDLNLYASEVLNSIREQLGQAPVKVNRNTMRLANSIARKVERDQFEKLTHYTVGIAEAAREHGLTSEHGYENLAIVYNRQSLSKDVLYANVLMSVVGMFYEGHTSSANRGYLHAKSLYKMDAGMGLAFSYVEESSTSKGILKTHIISVPENAVNEEERQSKWGINSSDVLEAPATNKEALKREADNALTAYATANGEALTAKTAYNKAKNDYDTLRATPKRTVSAQTLLTNAQKALDEATATRLRFAERLESLKETIANQMEALERATADLEEATANRNRMVDAYNSANDKLSKATDTYNQALAAKTRADKAVETAEAAVASVVERVNALRNAKENADENRKQLAENQKRLEALRQELSTARAKAKDAKAQMEKVGKEWATIKARYDLQELAKQPIAPEVKPNETVTPNEVKPNETVTPNEVKPNETVKPSEVKPNETVTPNEVKPNETVKPSEVKPNETVTPNEVKPNSNEVKSDETVKPNETVKPSEVKPNETVKPNEVKPNEVKPNEAKPNETVKSNEVKPNSGEVKFDETVKPNEVKPSEVKPNETVKPSGVKADNASNPNEVVEKRVVKSGSFKTSELPQTGELPVMMTIFEGLAAFAMGMGVLRRKKQ